jgi:release factor glutamine methyltransferase
MNPSSTVTDRPNTIAGSLRIAAQLLSGRSDSPQLDAEVLLGSLLGATRSALKLRSDETLDADTEIAYRELIVRRAGGVPVAYLTGVREFWSLPLSVTPAVLVPRPETELLVEQALELLVNGSPAVLDLGTGSGAIALAIASERRDARVVGVDISEEAVRVARANAHALGLARIEWRVGSWFAAVADQRFDIILSNPPYIGARDAALASLQAEPATALIGGPTGLEQLASIIDAAAAHLLPDGWLLTEHGAEQARAVRALFERRHFQDIRSFDDYSGRPRITRGRLRGPLGSAPSPNQEPA